MADPSLLLPANPSVVCTAGYRQAELPAPCAEEGVRGHSAYWFGLNTLQLALQLEPASPRQNPPKPFK